jgi:hypothetical protein
MQLKSPVTFLVAVGAAIAIVGTVSGCAGLSQQSGPDPLPANVKPPKIVGAYQLPDGFRNVVEFCNTAGDSLAVTSRGSDLAGGQNGGGLTSTVTLVKLADPRCKA